MFAQYGGARGTYYGLSTLDPRQSRPHGRNRSPSPCSQKFFKGCGWVGSFSGSAHPLSPNGRMCALHSPLPPFPTNPLSQHRNALCAHGCVVFDGDCVFCLRNTGGARGTYYGLGTLDPRQSRPHGRNRSQALRCVHQPLLPVDPTLFWFSRLSLEHTFSGMNQSHTLTTVQSVLGARASCLSSFHLELQTVVVVWNPDVYSRSKRPKRCHDPGLMTHSVVPLCVPGRPRLHGQGQLSQHRGCPK